MQNQTSRRVLTLAMLASLFACSAQGGEPNKYLPVDTKMLVSANLKLFLQSPLAKQAGFDQLEGVVPGIEEIKKAMEELGLDPTRDLHRLTIASPGGNDEDRGLVIVEGSFDLKKIHAFADNTVKDSPETVRKHKVTDGLGGFFLLYEFGLPQQEIPLFFAFPNNETFLLSPGKDYVVDALKKANLKKALPLENKDFQSLVESLDDKQTLSVALLGKALLEGDAIPGGTFKNMLSNVEAIGGGLTLGEDIELELVVCNKTEADARALTKSINDAMTQGIGLLALLATQDDQFGPVLEVVKSIRCRSKAKNLLIKASIPGEIIAEALQLQQP